MLLSLFYYCEETDRADFLQFVAFSKSVTSNMASGCIEVSCGDSKFVFACTCLMKLKIPINLASYAYCDGALRAVIRGNTFTTG